MKHTAGRCAVGEDFFGPYPQIEGGVDKFGNHVEAKGLAVTDPLGPQNGFARVYRGGDRCSAAVECRSAYRKAGSPDFATPSHGFRPAIVRTGR